MARARQRIIARRRMQQRIETIADDTQNTHGYSRFGLCRRHRRAGTPPLSLRPPCQSEIKRTLRRQRSRLGRRLGSRFRVALRPSFDADGERRFRKPRRYGFEMVDAPIGAAFCARIAINRKFTANPILGFFANFRRINLNANTCDLSTPVSRRVCRMGTTDNEKRDDRVARCFSCCVWHSGSGSCWCSCRGTRRLNRNKLPQIGASEAVSAATAAVSDMSQFCKRQPAACEVGGQAATVIGQRAADGARKVYRSSPTSGARPHRLDQRRRPNEAEQTVARRRQPRDTLIDEHDLRRAMARCRRKR